jgi:hypothetical protein
MKMAGSPDKNRRLAMLDADFDEIAEMYEQGIAQDRIAMRLSDKYGENISRALLSQWANKDENSIRLARARRQAADNLAEGTVDRAFDLADRVKVGLADRDDIAAERHLAEQSRWIAGVWNKDKYAPQNGVNVSVNVGAIHLDSLRSQPAVAASRPSELLAFDRDDVTDVEVHEVPQTLADLL